MPALITDRLTHLLGRVDATGPCWTWTGPVSKKGYGIAWDGRSVRHAHRIIYELLVGDIGDDLQLDHLCRSPACCNPDHLEPVTLAENIRRGKNRMRQHRYDDQTQLCARGLHPMTGTSCSSCHYSARLRRQGKIT